MRLTETPVGGAYVVEMEPRGDERGFFARAFCAEEFARKGLEHTLVQANDSFSAIAGTLRGLHYQLPPHEEAKLVRCIRGRLYDVIVDLRPSSPTFKHWFGVELSAANRLTMYVPRGVAHGFQTIEADTEVWYLVTAAYAPQHERGVRWNDPQFGITWPVEPTVMSDRDRALPDFK